MRRPPPSAWLLALLLAAPLAGAAGPAGALVVRYIATDLPEAPSAPDRWRYDYTVDAFPYDAGWGFTVYFDLALYGALETPLPSVGAGWNAVVVQPDPGSFDGFYDAEASVAAPSVATSFGVVFTWLGAGTPGPQPVDLRDPSYFAVEQGFTVPEAGGASASVAVLAALAARRRRARLRGLLALLGALVLPACGEEPVSAPPAAVAPAALRHSVAAYASERARLATRAAALAAVPVAEADPTGAAPDPEAPGARGDAPDETAANAAEADD